EIVLEGYVPVDEKRREGPYGDHTGFYSLADDYWVFHVTAITMRANPIYQSTMVGPPPQEDHHITDAIERLFLPLMKQPLPEVIDYRLPHEGVAHNLMLTKIKKEYPGQGRKVAHAVWGLGQAMFTKLICVSDTSAPDINSYQTYARHIARNLDVSRDLEFVIGPTETLDHATRALHFGSKVAIDMTRHFPGEPQRASVPFASDTPGDDELLAALKRELPSVTALNTPFKGEDRHLTFIALDKSRGQNARQVIAAMWRCFPDLPCAQRVIVYDAAENLRDLSRLTWIGLSHIDPERDVHFDITLDDHDGMKRPRRHPRRIGVDCTTKTAADGFTREWPTEQTYPAAVVQRANALLKKVGLL
ncbi:MAG: UbiD family decarboxylase, partial [Planctomycetaceae bacterium]|nr:UbiD family decarboxylase [Planctomycetaceae bacterium]